MSAFPESGRSDHQKSIDAASNWTRPLGWLWLESVEHLNFQLDNSPQGTQSQAHSGHRDCRLGRLEDMHIRGRFARQ